MSDQEFQDIYRRWLLTRRDFPGLEGPEPEFPGDYDCETSRGKHLVRLKREVDLDLFRRIP